MPNFIIAHATDEVSFHHRVGYQRDNNIDQLMKKKTQINLGKLTLIKVNQKVKPPILAKISGREGHRQKLKRCQAKIKALFW